MSLGGGGGSPPSSYGVFHANGVAKQPKKQSITFHARFSRVLHALFLSSRDWSANSKWRRVYVTFSLNCQLKNGHSLNSLASRTAIWS